MNRTLLLFDLDGTLVDSADIICAAQAWAFGALGLPVPTREASLSIVGLSLSEAFFELAGADGPIDALCDAYKQAFFELRNPPHDLEHLFEGAEALISAHARHPDFVLGIATGKTRRGVDAICDKYGWHDCFETIQSADDAPSKPHPAMVLQACTASGIAPARTMMIGDSSFDMRMAKAAGAIALGVAWGFQDIETLRKAGADLIVSDFASLDVAIAEFSRGPS